MKTVPKRILVLDDDVNILSIYALTLVRAGYTVDTAADGEQGWNALCTNDYDLLLTDNNMPRLTGVELVVRLRRAGITVPVIIITARPHQYPEAVRLGVDAFMEKPLDFPVLLRAIRKFTHEPEKRHTERITDRGFVTRLLNGNSANHS